MGEEDAAPLGALYDAHAAPIRRYVTRLTGDAAAAEDVVQETLLRAWRTPRILADDPESTRSWLFTVARHLVIDEARSARHRREHPVAESPEPEEEMRDATDAVFDQMLVEEALATLSAAHRAVVVRAYFAGMTTASIAADLGVREGTVKSRLHYALRALRLALQERGVTR